jgi:hypothetical protein
VDIIVVGFPKSGSTWLTRLLAEVLGSPARGYYRDVRKDDPVKEGADRVSDYEVWKTHRSVDLLSLPEVDKYKVIYIVRDIRDVICSLVVWSNWNQDTGFSATSKIINTASIPFAKEIKKGVWGGPTVDHRSWEVHIHEWLDAGVYWVSYESLLQDAFKEIDTILAHLDIDVSPEEIEEAIHSQSFNIKKEKFKGEMEKEKTYWTTYQWSFLNKGKIERYKEDLQDREIEIITKMFKDGLRRLGYKQ